MKNFVKETFNKVSYILMFIVIFIAITGITYLGLYAEVEAASGEIETNGINGFKKIASLSLVQDGVYVFKDNATKREFLVFYNDGDMEVVFR